MGTSAVLLNIEGKGIESKRMSRKPGNLIGPPDKGLYALVIFLNLAQPGRSF
jgi:hypothetical protein